MTRSNDQSITVHKLNADGEELICYEGTVLERVRGKVKLGARFNMADLDHHGLNLKTGDRFIEWYFNDRWYNVFAIYDGQTEALKGWYCNITRPARIEPEHIYAEDLALDLIVFPKGDWIVLDRDEFQALGLSELEGQAAEGALQDLILDATNFPSLFGAGSRLS